MEAQYSHKPGYFKHTDKSQKTFYKTNRNLGNKAPPERQVVDVENVTEGNVHELVFDLNGDTFLAVYTDMTQGGKSSVVITGKIKGYEKGRGKFAEGEVSTIETIGSDDDKRKVREAFLRNNGRGRSGLKGLDIKFWS